MFWMPMYASRNLPLWCFHSRNILLRVCVFNTVWLCAFVVWYSATCDMLWVTWDWSSSEHLSCCRLSALRMPSSTRTVQSWAVRNVWGEFWWLVSSLNMEHGTVFLRFPFCNTAPTRASRFKLLGLLLILLGMLRYACKFWFFRVDAFSAGQEVTSEQFWTGLMYPLFQSNLQSQNVTRYEVWLKCHSDPLSWIAKIWPGRSSKRESYQMRAPTHLWEGILRPRGVKKQKEESNQSRCISD